MNTIAIIPAREGSKTIKNKNIVKLLGKPLIYYAIEACINSKIFDGIFVTTDGDKISNLVKKIGISVIKRPKYLSADNVTLDPVIFYTHMQIKRKFKINPNFIFTIQPTSPLISIKDLKTAYNFFLKDKKLETVISVVKEPHLFWESKNGIISKMYKHRINRQKLNTMYRETGSIIACSRKQLNKGTRIGRKVKLLITDNLLGIDIDTINDLKLCEYILKK